MAVGYTMQDATKKDYIYLSTTFFVISLLLPFIIPASDYDDLLFIKGTVIDIRKAGGGRGGSSKNILTLSGIPEIDEINMPRFDNIKIEKGDYIEAGVKKPLLSWGNPHVWALDVNGMTVINYHWMVKHETGKWRILRRLLMTVSIAMFIYGVFIRKYPETALDRVKRKNEEK